MAEYIEHEATNKYYVVRDKNTGLYFRGKGVNKWGKYYNQASIYRIKAHAENTVEGETRRGAQPEIVEIRIVEASADVVEVVHGEWIITHDFDDNYEAMRPLGRVVRCSVCGYPTGHVKTNFCPECGADMRGDENGLSPETKQAILDDFMKGVE